MNDEKNNDDVKLAGKKEESLLFVYQNGWQRRLLEMYGNEMIMLDATYRTTRYALPLFFFVVKTNVDYQIVGLFVCENETEDCITEALSIIQSWNKNLKPRFAMSDYCSEEINSLEKVFEGKPIQPFYILVFIYHIFLIPGLYKSITKSESVQTNYPSCISYIHILHIYKV